MVFVPAYLWTERRCGERRTTIRLSGDDRGLRFTRETAELLSAEGVSMVRVRLGLTRVREVSTTGSRALR